KTGVTIDSVSQTDPRKRIREYIAEQNLMAAIELDERISYSASSLTDHIKAVMAVWKESGNWLFTRMLF
ncbi:toxin RelE, partial [Escherichia coli O78:H12 str. 00-3279]